MKVPMNHPLYWVAIGCAFVSQVFSEYTGYKWANRVMWQGVDSPYTANCEAWLIVDGVGKLRPYDTQYWSNLYTRIWTSAHDFDSSTVTEKGIEYRGIATFTSPPRIVKYKPSAGNVTEG